MGVRIGREEKKRKAGELNEGQGVKEREKRRKRKGERGRTGEKGRAGNG